jgi:hypothetical protein
MDMYAAGTRIGIDQLLRAIGRLVERLEFREEKLEVGHGLERPCEGVPF